jgi:hypothetical protein
MSLAGGVLRPERSTYREQIIDVSVRFSHQIFLPGDVLEREYIFWGENSHHIMSGILYGCSNNALLIG